MGGGLKTTPLASKIMDKKTLDNLEKDILRLKKYLSNFDTMSVLGLIANEIKLKLNNPDSLSKIQLPSPHKELLYIAGLLLSTEQKNGRMFSGNNFTRVKRDIVKITGTYGLLFFPTKEEIDAGLTEEWRRERDVSMPVFLNYFNTTPLYFREQLVERIEDWFMPVNEEFENHHGFSIEILLDIYNNIVAEIENYFKDFFSIKEEATKQRDAFLASIDPESGASIDELRELAQKHPAKDVFEKFFTKIKLVHHVSIKDLKVKYGEKTINKFIEIFSLTREERDFKYYTDSNPVEKAPLWKLSDDYLLCPFLEQLLNAIYSYLYGYFENSSKQQNFYTSRDKQSEIKTLNTFRNYFGDKATYYSSVFETDKSQNEHDLLICLENTLLIVEVKASKQKEPFRDPDKAFARIKRAFKSDRGIQKAYDQANNLKKLILSQDTTKLYDKNGGDCLSLEKSAINRIYIICVTADQFGMIASNLSLLLNKEESEPFPLSINLFDLETLINGFIHESLTHEAFLTYLAEREKYHKQFFASDELEIAGAFLTYKTLDKFIKNEKTHMFFTPDMSNIFDKFYFEKKGIEYDLEIDEEPALVDIREEIEGMFAKERNAKPSSKKKKKKVKPKRIIRKKKKKKKR